MNEIVIEKLVERFPCFLLDAYGVFWGSSETGMLPGAKELMEHLLSRGKRVGILSNSTQLASNEKEKLLKHGVKEGSHYHFLLTSGECAREILLSKTLPFPTPRNTYQFFGTGFVQAECIEDVDFFYIPVPHIEGEDQVNPEVFASKIREYAAWGIPFLCANPDHFAHEGSPKRLVVRQGLIAEQLHAQGAEVHFIGKPYPTVYERALRLFSAAPQEIVMIGDTPETDIRGGKQVGLVTALVTQTGIMHERLAKNANAFDQLRDHPDYLIKRFSYGF